MGLPEQQRSFYQVSQVQTFEQTGTIETVTAEASGGEDY